MTKRVMVVVLVLLPLLLGCPPPPGDGAAGCRSVDTGQCVRVPSCSECDLAQGWVCTGDCNNLWDPQDEPGEVDLYLAAREPLSWWSGRSGARLAYATRLGAGAVTLRVDALQHDRLPLEGDVRLVGKLASDDIRSAAMLANAMGWAPLAARTMAIRWLVEQAPLYPINLTLERVLDGWIVTVPGWTGLLRGDIAVGGETVTGGRVELRGWLILDTEGRDGLEALLAAMAEEQGS